MERLPNETLAEYYARLKSLRGSLLGTGGMMDQPLQTTPEPEVVESPVTSAPLGQVVVNQPEEDNSDPATPLKPATLEDMIRQTSGQAFDPLDLLSALVPGGTMLAIGADYVRDREIEKALVESGLTKDQANIAMQDPDYVAQLLYGNKLGVAPESDYDPTQTNSTKGSGFGFIGNLFRDLMGDDVASTLGSPAPTVQAPTLTGMPQGMLTRDGQDLYITSDGDVRDVTGKSKETQAGLRAVTAGMFDTPAYYEDDYAEPEEDNSEPATTTASDSWWSSDSEFFI